MAGIGRSRGANWAYAVGALAAGAFLGGSLAVSSTILPARPDGLGWMVGLVWAGLVALEFSRGSVRRMSGNFVVPADWVSGYSWRVALFWGLVHGLALLTEAPFIAFHAAVVGALWLNDPRYALAASLLFAVGRIATTASTRIRTRLVASFEVERTINTRSGGRLDRTPILIGRDISYALTLAFAVALAVVPN